MKPTIVLVLLGISLLFSGCTATTGTKVYQNGQKTLETSADAEDIRLTPDGGFSARKLNHSKPITARWTGARRIVREGAAGAKTFLKP